MSIWKRQGVRVKTAAGLILTLAWPVMADTWIARCHNLEFQYDRVARSAKVFLKTPDGTFQVTSGAISFDNDVAVRAPLEGVPEGVKGAITEVGLNRSRGIVYLLSRHPGTGQVKDGVFCETPVLVEP